MSTLFDALADLARNHRWTFHPPTRALLEAIPGADPAQHPVATLAATTADDLESWLDEHQDQIEQLHDELTALMAGSGDPEIAYFSPEYGVAASVAQYSGGLGILAGDHLKAASDLGLPLVGVGLFYQRGFFRQVIEKGRQVERFEEIPPEQTGAEDTGVTVEVPIDGRAVQARVWRQHVGRTQLLLLDTNLDANGEDDRHITDHLYSGDRRHRLDQELVLGVGGVRALRALGLGPDVFHLNEGHACFLLLELLAEHVETGTALSDAIESVRSRTLFTTHTPVPAGIDRFARELIEPELRPWAERLGTTVDTILEWALLPTDGDERPFNTAALAFHLCGHANGVSQLHAEVSRDLFSSLPRAARVVGITNGVHAGTWVSPGLQTIYDRDLGPGWRNGLQETWARAATHLDRDEFSRVRQEGRHALVDLVAAATGVKLDPEGCLIGFARRFAPYKRATLLMRDPAGLEASLDSGAQFIFAGKAHPADEAGKAVLAELAALAERSHGRVVIIPDYDIAIARAMYAGSDVWLNNPIKPREASGTSGEKAALNGVLNCSIRDGWWADWYVEGVGWAIPTSNLEDPERRDVADATALHGLLHSAVLPTFADGDRWWEMTISMLAHLGPRVTAGRMVGEYEERFYRPIRKR